MYFLYEDYAINNKFGLECHAIVVVQNLSTQVTFPTNISLITGQVAMFPDTQIIRDLIREGKDLNIGNDGMPSVQPLEIKYVHEEISEDTAIIMGLEKNVKANIVAKALGTTIDKISALDA
ncbi:MAG: hypothetical protein ACRCTS_10275 [Fusobacteriaceae bacterium]